MVSEERIREVIIEDIIKRELGMFGAVRMSTTSHAQQTPRDFERAQRIQLEVFSTDTLKAYHGDLLAAERNGINLIELRYGRMDNLIGCLNLNPMIDEIMEIETRWRRELEENRPEFRDDLPGSEALFPLRCELETFSDRTLESYYDDVLAAEAAGRNLAEERYMLARALQEA